MGRELIRIGPTIVSKAIAVFGGPNDGRYGGPFLWERIMPLTNDYSLLRSKRGEPVNALRTHRGHIDFLKISNELRIYSMNIEEDPKDSDKAKVINSRMSQWEQPAIVAKVIDKTFTLTGGYESKPFGLKQIDIR